MAQYLGHLDECIFFIVEPKGNGELFSVFDCRILNILSAVCLMYSSKVMVGNGAVCGNQYTVRTSQHLVLMGM